MARRFVQAHLAELPEGAEAADARLRSLLKIYEELNSRGCPEPPALLAGVLGIPVDVLVVHVRGARRG